MRRQLKLQHHRHTGKVLAHHHTSYRALALVLLVAGFVIIGAQWCLRQPVGADTLNVYATVPAPIPTDPASITNPIDGSASTVAVIDVQGNCPIMTPAVTVAIYDNNALKGSAPCDTNGTFSVQITLMPGLNNLLARTITITGDNGPDSTNVKVTYLPPENSGGSSNESLGSNTVPSGQTPLQTPEPVGINSSQSFILMGADKSIVWVGSLNGGRPPYTVNIDWGDGHDDIYRNVDNLEHTYSHTYHDYGDYTMIIKVTDRDGNEAMATLSVMSVVDPPPITGGGSLISITPPNGTNISPGFLIGIYGGYITILASAGIIWLHAHTAGYAYATANSASTKKLPKSRRA